ncbi:MAG: PASTA domain-containing protein [Treponema sp.]|jgi:beta-lactam-binding protein with PASTA domain|nr:PASTA domain-containing protein [Treponema sp.]
MSNVIEGKEKKGRKTNFGFVMLMAVCLIALTGVIAVAVFFVTIQGEEETMVPDVRGKTLTESLLELQVKELYPRIQLRYTQSSADKGLILEQDPQAGAIVKAGRRINLVVSQGMIMNTVENYKGRNIDEVRIDLQALFASLGIPLLTLKEPFMYEYSSEPAGTILQQQPEAGTSISDPIVLELVVSRGPENTTIRLPTLTGLSLEAALEEIGHSQINFNFIVREAADNEIPETVVAQRPEAQSLVAANTLVNLTLTAPAYLSAGEVFRVFSYPITRNPYPLATRLEALLPSGERRRLINVLYLGGEFAVPYRLPIGSVLILSMLDREIHRETVVAPRED